MRHNRGCRQLWTKGEWKTIEKIKLEKSVSVTRDCFAPCKPLSLLQCKNSS